ncbi:MAG: TIGR03085 family metal-binding protein [Blastococcus sp.]
MSSSSPSFVDRERRELADLFEQVGPAAPTLCDGWDAAHLASHLVSRERRPDALPGLGAELVVPGNPLTTWTHRLEDRLRTSTSFADLVGRLRAGPPAWSPLAWPPVNRMLNTTEFAIHHEDVRRAQPDWSPRQLPVAAQDTLWNAAGLFARRAAGRRGLVLRRSDVPGATKRFGAGGRTVEGEPMELLLWASGRRDHARVTVS